MNTMCQTKSYSTTFLQESQCKKITESYNIFSTGFAMDSFYHSSGTQVFNGIPVKHIGLDRLHKAQTWHQNVLAGIIIMRHCRIQNGTKLIRIPRKSKNNDRYIGIVMTIFEPKYKSHRKKSMAFCLTHGINHD